MQKSRIIANNFTEEDLQKGYLSIRFLPDGFSFLFSNPQHDPLLLYSYTGTGSASATICRDELDEYGLIRQFTGETTILTPSLSATLIPEHLFAADKAAEMLDFSCYTPGNETILAKKIHRRPWYMVFAVAPQVEKLASELGSGARVLHSAVAMFSLADQIAASDHQRGFLLAESQDNSLEVLLIKDDQPVLSNRYAVKNDDETIYHILNTIKQTGMDRGHIPVYLGGEISTHDESLNLLKRYIRKVEVLPYVIQGTEKSTALHYMLLSEAISCA